MVKIIKSRLELLKNEFNLFESKINELEDLRRILNDLNTSNFKKESEIVQGKLSDVRNIQKVRMLIDELKSKIERSETESKRNLTQFIEDIFECNDNLTTWSQEKLREKYIEFTKKYKVLPANEQVLVYNLLIKIYTKIKDKDGPEIKNTYTNL